MKRLDRLKSGGMFEVNYVRDFDKIKEILDNTVLPVPEPDKGILIKSIKHKS